MIGKVHFGLKNNIAFLSNISDKKNDNIADNSSDENFQIMTYPNSENLKSYLVNFGRSQENFRNNKTNKIKKIMTPPAKEALTRFQNIAEKYYYDEITPMHIHYACLLEMKEYIAKLDEGKVNFDNNDEYRTLAENYQQITTEELFKSKKLRNLVVPVIDAEIKNIEKKYFKPYQKTHSETQNNHAKASETFFSDDLLNDIKSEYKQYNRVSESQCEEIGDGRLHEFHFFQAMFNTTNIQFRNEVVLPFVFRMQEAIMTGKEGPQDGATIHLYDAKAKNVLKNLGLGTNMFVLHSSQTNPSYMVNNLVNILQSGENFNGISKENTDILYINDFIHPRYLYEKINRLANDKDKKHIVIFDIDKLINNIGGIPENLSEKIEKYAPENVCYVVLSEKDFTKEYRNFETVTMPILTCDQAKKAFKEEPKLMADVSKKYTPDAIDAVVDATINLNGEYPQKATSVMKKIGSYYVDNEKITKEDVENYRKEAVNLFKNNETNETTIVDTGKKLSDIIGIESTKKELKCIIEQIKDKSLGTKGYIIYSQDGCVGGGRKFSAEVIAGETNSPFIEINASDFGTREVSIFDKEAKTEVAIKQLFAKLKSQAEISPNKSAVLFIEDFEYFTFGENVSVYHKKAMTQLVREMKNANKEGFNIVVIGSVDSSENISESTKKTYVFTDKIAVESITHNKVARESIIKNYIKKHGILIQAKDIKKTISDFADTTANFSFMELQTLLEKSKSIMKERNHTKLTKGDFIEAYLQTTTGRTISGKISEHGKKITTSHECGHALNLALMYKIASEQGEPWHLPEKVNFITLDPRGDYGGAMYPKESINGEYSFERIFSDLICDYGGHSSEKTLYNIDGSWGISGDLASATKLAYLASSKMGQGHYYGKKSLSGVPFVTDLDKRQIRKDADVFTRNACFASNLIVNAYKDFIEQFTEKHYVQVGTGEALITSDEFEKELENWHKHHPGIYDVIKKDILNCIDASKNGKIYKSQKRK